MSLVEQFIADLRAEGMSVDGTSDPGVYALTRQATRRSERPVTLVVSEEGLRACLASTAADSAGAFPEVDPEEAAYRMLLIDVEEVLAGSSRQVLSLTVARGGLQPIWSDAPVPPPYDISPEDVGHLEWVMAPRDRGIDDQALRQAEPEE